MITCLWTATTTTMTSYSSDRRKISEYGNLQNICTVFVVNM
jgi:hypothetical protein